MAREHPILRRVEHLLLAAGLAALAWCAFVYIEARIAQRMALETLERTRTVTAPGLSAPVGAPPDSAIIAVGAPLAELSIPRLHLSAVVLEGSDDRILRRGPGHIEHTARPGESGNVGIAGHRDTFFRPLRDTQVGDEVFLDTPAGRLRYQVSSVRIVSAREVSVLDPTTGPTLTLVTCYPFWFVGNAPMRFVVRATGVGVPERGTP